MAINDVLKDMYKKNTGKELTEEAHNVEDTLRAINKDIALGGGGGSQENPILPLLLLRNLETDRIEDGGATTYCVGIRIQEQVAPHGMDSITSDELHTQIVNMKGYNSAAGFLYNVFYGGIWYCDDTLLAIVKIEANTEYELYDTISQLVMEAELGGGYWDLKSHVAANILYNYFTKSETQTAIILSSQTFMLRASSAGQHTDWWDDTFRSGTTYDELYTAVMNSKQISILLNWYVEGRNPESIFIYADIVSAEKSEATSEEDESLITFAFKAHTGTGKLVMAQPQGTPDEYIEITWVEVEPAQA